MTTVNITTTTTDVKATDKDGNVLATTDVGCFYRGHLFTFAAECGEGWDEEVDVEVLIRNYDRAKNVATAVAAEWCHTMLENPEAVKLIRHHPHLTDEGANRD